jgi:AraC family transcriptional activator of pobA
MSNTLPSTSRVQSLDEDQFLLAEFRKAIRRYAQTPVLNLDKQFNHKFEFFVHLYQEIIPRVGMQLPPNRWSYHRIGLIKKGSADFTCGIYKFKAKKNTLIIIPSRMLNTSVWEEDATGYLVVFNLDFFFQNNFPHKLLENKRTLNASVQPYLYLTDEEANKIEDIFKTIVAEKQGNRKHKNELIAIKLIELIILAERFYESEQIQTDRAPREIVKQFSQLVEANFMTERNVSFYASKLFVHPNYLNALIKTATGFTSKESIQNRIVLEAKFLLHSTDLSVKEISNELGFDDPNYFTVFFKRHVNVSPAAYRASFV